MSMDSEKAAFDPQAVTVCLYGTWAFPPHDRDGLGYIHFTDTGRAVQSVTYPDRPDRRIPMRLWYSVESPTQLRFRPNPNHEGWLRGYRVDGEVLTISADDRSWACTKVSPPEIPEWFPAFLVSALARWPGERSSS